MKTICIYHSRDLDGWMSVAVVIEWFKTIYDTFVVNFEDVNKNNSKGFPLSDNVLILKGWDYGDKLPDIKEYDRVIIADVTLPREVMIEIDTAKELIWIDHHKSAIKDMKGVEIKGLRDIKYSACELAWRYFFKDIEMPKLVEYLGLYDSFRHKGTDKEIEVLEFQYGARYYIKDPLTASSELELALVDMELKTTNRVPRFHFIMNKGKELYRIESERVKEIYNKRFEVVLKAGKDEITNEEIKTSTQLIFGCVNAERINPINFGIDYHKDNLDGFTCFWFNGKVWQFSLYNDNGKVDVSEIAKSYGGGGHRGAAGFIVNEVDKLLKEIKLEKE